MIKKSPQPNSERGKASASGESFKRPCPGQPVSYHDERNCHFGSDQILKKILTASDTSRSMNGGHYLTIGHFFIL